MRLSRYPRVTEAALYEVIRRLLSDKTSTIRESKNRGRLDLSVVIPLMTAIIAGLIGFVSSVYVGYLNNAGTAAVEHEKSVAQVELERQKFKTSLILEAVETGDKAKAIDNLTFLSMQGF